MLSVHQLLKWIKLLAIPVHDEWLISRGEITMKATELALTDTFNRCLSEEESLGSICAQ